ncbi:ATP-binding protein [Maridesulfovibrio sp.]|uniref:sensor histidine kinase n=1 Tax=Maridesulfovibrio sp. TaxID=2795000 RepID=UPI0029F4B4E4|nr:ATP-binding protein [Maridesulfovibrio sp.]
MPSFNSIIVENIVESIDVGIMVISREGEIEFLNSAACKILKLDITKHIGLGWGEIFITDATFNTEFNQVILDVISEQKAGLKHIVPYTIKGRECPQKLSITSSYLTENEEILGLVFLFEDITDIYNAEQREKKILSRNAELQKERIESLNSMSQAVAHQVLNPTTVIGGMTNLLSRKLDKEDPVQRELKIISEEAMKLEGLVAAVKTYSNIPKPYPSEISCEELFRNALSNVNSILERSGEHIEMELNCEVEKITVGKEMFEDAIVEILLNASNFTLKNVALVTIEIKKKNNTIQIRIMDQGMGIEPQIMHHVLDPFFSTKAKGVGMGLPRVKKIIFEHQGTLEIESAGSGKGTTVIIEIPSPDPKC